jgi:hypothetical protein
MLTQYPMKSVSAKIFLVLLMSSAFSARAANRFWIAAAASNWNNVANWSNVSGGAPGASVPGAADVVTFDNNGAGNCTIDAAVNISSLTMSALYAGTISQGIFAITTANAASFAGGTFAGGSGTITINGAFTLSGTTFTSSSGILELRNNAAFTGGSFAHNNGTLRFNGAANSTISGNSPATNILEFVGNGHTYNLTCVGNVSVLQSLNLTGASLYTLNTGTISVSGDINISNTATGSGGNALILIIGNGVQNLNGAAAAGEGALPQLTINKASGTLNLANYPSVANNFTYTAGTIAAGTSTVCFVYGTTGAITLSGSVTLNNISFIVSTNTTFTIPAATTLTASGDLTLAGTANLILNTGFIQVNGNVWLTNTGLAGGGTATISLVGSGTETVDGTVITSNETRLPIFIFNSSGTVKLAGNISFSNNVTYTAGTILPQTSTAYLVSSLTMTGSFSLYNLTIAGSANINVTVAAGSTVTATNILDLESGAFNININTGTLAVQGNIIDNNTGLAGGGTGTLLIDGAANQSISSTGVIDQGRFPAVTINMSAGTLTLPSLITVRGNWTYVAGTLDVSTNNSTVYFENTLTITGSHTLNNVNFFGAANYTMTTAAGTTLTLSGTMTISGTNSITLNTGNINLNGNLDLTNTSVNGGGTTVISFVSSTNQNIVSALPINECNLPAVTINKGGGTLSFPPLITVKGNWTYVAGTLDVTTNSSDVVFANTLTIAGSHTLYQVTLEGNANHNYVFSAGTLLTTSNTLNITGASNVNINTAGANGTTVLAAQGDVDISNTSAAGGGTGNILIDGSGAQALSSTSSAGQGRLPYLTIQKPSGTLTFSGIISESRSWTFTSGTVDAATNASTVVFGGNNLSIASAGMSFYHVQVIANTSTLTNNMTIAGNLTISGTGILAPGANSIFLAGNWSDRSTAGFTEATSLVDFDGSTLQTITCPGGENFSNLTVNNTGTGVQLINAATVSTVLNMTLGNIDLNSNTLTLGLSVVNSGTLNWTSGTMINTGTFTRWEKAAVIASGASAGLFPVGTAANFRPFFISAPSVGPTAGGTIALSYTDATTNSSVSIADPPNTIVVRKDLNWAVSTAGLTGGTYNLQVQGTGYGLIGVVSDLRISLAASVVGSIGVNAGTSADPQVNRTSLSLANLTNTFYIGSIDSFTSPLPVELIYFTAIVLDGRVKLDWETALETNDDHFTVERSTDGSSWADLVEVAGKGTTDSLSTYEAYDNGPYSGLSYYRLRQTDLDGISYYSPIRTVIFSGMATAIAVFPNPASDHLVIASNNPGSLTVQLFDLRGIAVHLPLNYSGSTAVIYLSGLADGIYFLRIQQGTQMEIHKFLLKK